MWADVFGGRGGDVRSLTRHRVYERALSPAEIEALAAP